MMIRHYSFFLCGHKKNSITRGVWGDAVLLLCDSSSFSDQSD